VGYLLADPGSNTPVGQAQVMDRLHELESLRRSIAAANPRSAALDREEAMSLIIELQDVERKRRALKDGLWKLLEDQD